jgi:hypothetical protein
MANKQNGTVKPSQEIVPEVAAPAVFSTDDLREIDTFDAALALVQSEFGDVADATEELGDGFALVKDKDELVGKPMILIEWSFRPGDFGTFVSIRAMVRESNGTARKVVFNDGSTGIADMLADWTKRHDGRNGGMVVPKGLRVSTYMYEDPKDGSKRPAKTFYLDTSK